MNQETMWAAQTKLHEAIATAQSEAHAVEKDARNQFHRYNYVSAEAMIGDAKKVLAKNGLALVPQGFDLVPNPGLMLDTTSRSGEKTHHDAAGVLRASWLLLHKAGGSLQMSLAWPVVPEAGRPLDKAVAAARTASLNYLLRDLLQFPRVEEGTELDEDSRDRAQEPPRQAPPQKPAPQAEDAEPPPSASRMLVDIKRALFSCTSGEEVDKVLSKWASKIEKMPARARPHPQTLATIRKKQMDSVALSPEEDSLLTTINELGKE